MSSIMIITGTSKGIGKYLAEYYLQNGMKVYGCSRSESTIVRKNYFHFPMDIADEKSVKEFIVNIAKEEKKIDYLINNAGIASMNHALLTPMSVVENIFRTNVFGTFLFCREVGKIMAKSKFGRIINFTTIAVPLDLEGESIYAASKAAIESLTRILAKELSSFNITCNAIGPSPIQTDLIKNISVNKLKKLLDKLAIKQFGGFEDVINVTNFFLSDSSDKISGQIIYLGGIS